MLNKNAIYRLNKDKTTGNPILRQKFTATGKEVFCGQFNWKTLKKNKEGKQEYANMNFIVWSRSIYELFLSNSKEGFSIEGDLQPNNYRNKEGKMVYAFEIVVKEATIFQKLEKPVQHFQETESDADNWTYEPTSF